MTAKEYVKSHYPKARAERQIGNDKKVYWLVRPELHIMYIATGKTESKAWTNAKNIIEDKVKNTFTIN
jgi:hypothetical protein